MKKVNRNIKLTFLVSREEWELIVAAANREDLPLGPFIRRHLKSTLKNKVEVSNA